MPLKLIHELIRLGGERDKRMANINSVTTARLTGIILAIAQSFSKKKSPPPSIDGFLPFPLDEDNAALLLPELESDKEILPSPAIATDIGETTPFTL